jgi:hypothetical protein
MKGSSSPLEGIRKVEKVSFPQTKGKSIRGLVSSVRRRLDIPRVFLWTTRDRFRALRVFSVVGVSFPRRRLATAIRLRAGTLRVFGSAFF